MNIKDIPKGLLGTVSTILEKKTVKEVDEPTPEGEKSFKDLHLRDLEVSQFIEKILGKTTKDLDENDQGKLAALYTKAVKIMPHTLVSKLLTTSPKLLSAEQNKIRKEIEALRKKMKIDEVDEPAPEGEKSFKNFHLRDLEVSQFIEKHDPESDVAEARGIAFPDGDQIPIGIGPKADAELLGWIRKRIEAKPTDKKNIEKRLKIYFRNRPKKLNLLKSFWDGFYESVEEAGPRWIPDEPGDRMPTGIGPKADEELVMWLKKRLKARPQDKEYVEKLLKKLRVQKSFWKKFYGESVESVEEAGPRWMPDEPDDQIPSANWYGPKADAKLVVWLKKRLKVKPRDKKYVDRLLNYINVKKPFWKKFYEGADKDVKGDKEAYQKFFQGMLKKFGVKSPAELSGDKKKELYDAIDAGWKADDEKKESTLDEKINMNALDWGKTTAKRNANLDKYAALKTSKEKEAFIRALKGKSESKSGTGYELYHDTFSGAMQHAYDFAKKKLGVTVDPNEIDRYVALGPKRPSKGKTNSYRLKSTNSKKGLAIQVYNTGKSYELNMYAIPMTGSSGFWKDSVDEDIISEAIEYEIKNGKIYISKKDFAKVHKDYKNTQKGKERMSVMEPKTQGTVSMEVVFEDVYAESVEAVVNFLGENK